MADIQSMQPDSERSNLSFPPHLLGRIRDVDTHEMYPARVWAKEYGDFVRPLAQYFLKNQSPNIANSSAVDRIVDDLPINAEELASYWGKGCLSPSAFDFTRRVEFMDVAGIKDSLVFGTIIPIFGQQLVTIGTATLERMVGGPTSIDPITMGHAMIKAHNDWCIRTARISPRLRPVAVILTGSLKDAMAEIQRMIDGGVRAISVPAGQLVEGRAPAHPDNDPLWELCARNDVPVLLHIGSEKAFVRDFVAWADAPLFAANNSVPTEGSVDPFSLATSSFAAQNYLTNLVLGAVFERVPNLRLGAMECGSFWVGSTAENMDVWAEFFARRFKGVLSMKPSEYIRRNVRVSPFHFEPFDKCIERFPYLEDVYCFSSDYPHVEGGNSPREIMLEKMKPFGASAVEKFFITNSEWIMPN